MANASPALSYIRRVLENEFVQEQLRDAMSGARAAVLRARKRRSRAVEDKRLYRNLRQAATALQKATSAIKPPEPEPKRRGRKLAVVALAIAATAFVTVRLQKQYSQRTGEEGSATPGPESPVASTTAQGQTPEPQPAAAGSPATDSRQ